MTSHPTVLVAGTNARNLELLCEFLDRQGYAHVAALGLQELDRAIGTPGEIAVALVDVTGFDSSIWDRCRTIHDRQIRLVIVSSRDGGGARARTEAPGAAEVMVKPLIMRELADLITSLLRE